ncbi:MAG TPA: ammonia-forming cytochrome c nitrite reductase subunit c552 [Thermoguttaceae bacterium]|nr:ammonia-forming cytochrome c nitrite reductase subunit c552 [Thermoguttaceae bacterium]
MSAKNRDRNRNKNGAASQRSAVWRGYALFAAAAVAVFLLGLLAASIFQRRAESMALAPREPIAPPESDSSHWAVNFPREYDSYRLALDSATKTKYGGAEPRDYLAETPANVILFAGYAFAKEYRQARGHLHAIEDVTKSERVGPTTAATCWTCKSPDVVRLMADLGPADFYSQTFDSLKSEITHPIGCLDCHDPKTMQLRVARPTLGEALKRQNFDLAKASHQEMRSLVCAQCHAEYYFKGKGNYLTFPWDNGTISQGISPEAMAKYYDKNNFADWTHAVSGAPMVKMQHPDYELYKSGIHAYRGVACADCHMPYRSEGGAKFTDHHVQSPLLNVANSCAVCHRWSEQEIRARVESIQDKVREGRDRAERVVAMAHFDVAAAQQAGAKDDELTEVRRLVREAQLRWDYVAASNSMGFHSPTESMRILGAAVDTAGQCRVEAARILAKHGVTGPVAYPDFSTKAKAQALAKAFADGKGPNLLPAG